MLVSSFHPEQIEAFIRPGLSHLLQESLESSDFDRASIVLQAFVDTWPLGSIISVAEQRWKEECDPLGLAVLSRAREVLSLLSPSIPELELPKDLPPHRAMKGEELAQNRAELCALAAKGELLGVVLKHRYPLSLPVSLRLVNCAWRPLHRMRFFDTVQQVCLPQRRHCLRRPSAVHLRAVLVLSSSGCVTSPNCPEHLLGLNQGDARPVGWLLWNGPAKPLPVTDSVFQLIRSIDKGFEAAAEDAGLSIEDAQGIIRELVQLGVLSA